MRLTPEQHSIDHIDAGGDAAGGEPVELDIGPDVELVIDEDDNSVRRWSTGMLMQSAPEPSRGCPLQTDSAAESAPPDVPAFGARPEEAQVYAGFPVLEDVEVDGFKLGLITDWEAHPDDYGDAYVVAPDGSRAGLVWEVSERSYFQEIRAPEPGRWGIWSVAFPLPMTSRENARRNLAAVLPELRARWQRWKAAGPEPPPRP